MAQNPNEDNKQQGLSWSSQKPEQVPAPVQAPKAAPAPAPQAPAKPAPAKAKVSAERGEGAAAAKIAGWLAAGVVAGVLVAWGGTTLFKGGTSTEAGSLQSASSTDNSSNSTGGLTVTSPQKAGMSVAASATVSEPTWVVVYESRGGTPGNVLGAALFFPGTPSGTVELLRATAAGQTYFVTERSDNGDHQFSKSDPLLPGPDGEPMWVSFTAN